MKELARVNLAVVLPALNEEDGIGETLSQIPRQPDGVQQTLVVVVDDGSQDDTSQVALSKGADVVVRSGRHRGLSAAFRQGLDVALALGADLVVTLDADNQYDASEINRLLAPLVRGEADICLGVRPIESNPDFSWTKKKLQRLGSWVVSRIVGQPIRDAVTGFRAYTREAALHLSVISPYTYTVETLVQAAYERFRIAQVPVKVHPVNRPSRLFRNLWVHVARMAGIVLSITVTYYPLRVFSVLATALFLPGLGLCARFLYYYAAGAGQGKIQSLILASMLILLASAVLLVGLVAGLVATNRSLLQQLVLEQKRALLQQSDALKRVVPPGGVVLRARSFGGDRIEPC